MNKKTLLKTILILFTISIILSGCNIADGEIKDKISAPEIKKPPIEGKWKIRKVLGTEEENSIEENDENIGSEGLFRKEAVIIGSDYTLEPSFRIKNVKIEDYFYKFNIDYNDFDINNDVVQIITILNEGKYFTEVVKTENEHLIIYKDEKFYIMDEIASEVSLEEVNRYIEIEKAMFNPIDRDSDENLDTGLLLGIKTSSFDEENQLSSWKYETIFLNLENKNIKGIYKTEDLFLPRKNGFWTVGIDRRLDDGIIKDKIVRRSDEKKYLEAEIDIETKKSLSLRSNQEKANLTNIMFLSNDHISTERIELDNTEKRIYETYTLDNILENKPMKFSDIIGEEGEKIFVESAEGIIDINDDISVRERNISLKRKDGYWVFQGRVNYIEKEEELYKDFDIKSIPPEEIIKYDKLIIPWTELKAQFPMIKDAFSSPNEDVIIIQTDKELRVLEIDDTGKLKEDPIAIIELPKNTTVVMIEWATGRYPEIWSNEFQKLDYEVVEQKAKD